MKITLMNITAQPMKVLLIYFISMIVVTAFAMTMICKYITKW